MIRIGIIGPESTGKSTLAQILAERLGGVFVPEYARTYVAQKGTTDVSYDELCEIAKHQIEELSSLPFRGETEGGFVIFDTELIITKVWFEYAFGQVPDWLDEALLTYPMNLYLLCQPDIPWEADPTRSNGSDEIRWELFHRYEKELQRLAIPYYIIKHEA